jgi:hypothetical protein
MTPEQAREIAAPDSWPWPMSQEAQRWVEQCVSIDADIARIVDEEFWDLIDAPAEQFNRAEHERFMRGLG